MGNLASPWVPVDYLPRVDNYYACIISTNQEADELLAKGYNFGAYELNLRSSLDKGAQACCIFIDKEFAHMMCNTANKRGKDAIEPRPFHVDYDNSSIVYGKAFTLPKFRRLRLRKYSGYLMRKDATEKGYKWSYATTEVNNYQSYMNATHNPYSRILSRCRYAKILWFKYFKETKIGPMSAKEFLEQRFGKKMD